MSTPHIAANKGNIAETILLPGDPLRAKFIVENFLENVIQYNSVRNMFGYTGNYKGKKVAVIGGGNVAMDCARTIKRLGAEEVDIIYRRAEEQMPAEEKEIEEAKQEGIKFLFQNNIVKIIGNQKVEKLELIKTKLVQKEGEKRKVPINIENSNYIIDIDYVIMALGSMPEQFTNDLKLDLDKYGYIIVDEKNRTSKPKIFAGGDIAGGKGTVAWAARSGRDAANSIDEYLQNI